MDFNDAADRLAKDQSKIRGRRGVAISDKAKKQAEYQRRQEALLRAERGRKKQLEDYQKQYMRKCERQLREKALGPSSGRLLLRPTSIYGDGDKIALPPSVLETLTSSNSNADDLVGGGNPWTFRIGILNPNYTFPSSPLVQTLKPPEGDDDDEDAMEKVDSDDEDDGGNDQQEEAAYMDELGFKYLSYTHCTVVEFTQDEGFVGIPQHIASSLLDPKNRHVTLQLSEISTTRTVDPAYQRRSSDSKDLDGDETMDTSPTLAEATEAVEGEQTPGHLAWGRFDLPDADLEITMVRLPKGRGCTLVPTPEAVQNNFYGLKDVKMVLEQSLIRTRATLSKGDLVSTWHRGIKYDLDVTKVTPAAYAAVTCINTDIEVDIGEANMSETSSPQQEEAKQEVTAGDAVGFRLGDGQSISPTASLMVPASRDHVANSIDLLPEPPVDQRDGVCAVQIRFSGGQGKRRFAVDTAQVKDLFAFAASLMNGRNEESFRLVTRFPRRELTVISSSRSIPGCANPGMQTLAEAGVLAGQELFLVENL